MQRLFGKRADAALSLRAPKRRCPRRLKSLVIQNPTVFPYAYSIAFVPKKHNRHKERRHSFCRTARDGINLFYARGSKVQHSVSLMTLGSLQQQPTQTQSA